MKTAIECPTSQQIKALTLGQLSNEDSDSLFQHISECDQCRSELETVEDGGDSLVESLRDPADFVDFSGEPDCRMAVAKALGALAISESTSGSTQVKNLPKIIGEYEIVRPIGSGGMGNVFLARHTKLGRQVALKVLASHRLADAHRVERFEVEMRTIGRLSHPNIVIAYDAREVDGTAVLITEFVAGLDLGQLLQRMGALKIADACEIVRRTAVALCYTNSQGFVHRDIKPSNIILSDEGEIKLLDLGLARLQSGESETAELTYTGQAMGTADYVAPEQVTDSKSVDIRADIYSLGCTLFKLLAGRAPFADEQHLTNFAKMTAHVSETPPSLAECLPMAPSSLVQLVDSMLAKKPSNRPSNPEEVSVALSPHCKDYDLKRLINDAKLLEPRKDPLSKPSTIAKPKTQSWMKRTVPRYMAIAAGFLGVLLGVCLSIIIVITNPDGTKTFLQLAEGSRIEVREGGDKTLSNSLTNESDQDAIDTQLWSDLVTPLSFGVLVNRESTGHSPMATEAQILEATRLLRASDGSKPVPTPVGTWHIVKNNDLGAPIKEMNAGKTFVLVSDEQSIHWKKIQGHILDIEIDVADLNLTFDKELGNEITLLSKRNIRNQLAIIDGGIVNAAPVINTAIGEKVSITGTFNPYAVRSSLQMGMVNKPQSNEAKLAQLRLNLREIGLAFQNYGSAFGKLPGTANTDDRSGWAESGEKVYPFSWRVAILPYLGYPELYNQYRFNQPWDSEHNLKMLEKMPSYYRSPFADAVSGTRSDGDAQSLGMTNIVGFASENSALGTAGGFESKLFTDGLSNTLLVVETIQALPWTKPVDIEGGLDPALFFTNHPFTYLTVDGEVHSLGDRPSDETLRKMISRNGGETEEEAKEKK